MLHLTTTLLPFLTLLSNPFSPLSSVVAEPAAPGKQQVQLCLDPGMTLKAAEGDPPVRMVPVGDGSPGYNYVYVDGKEDGTFDNHFILSGFSDKDREDWAPSCNLTGKKDPPPTPDRDGKAQVVETIGLRNKKNYLEHCGNRDGFTMTCGEPGGPPSSCEYSDCYLKHFDNLHEECDKFDV